MEYLLCFEAALDGEAFEYCDSMQISLGDLITIRDGLRRICESDHSDRSYRAKQLADHVDAMWASAPRRMGVS